jgi:uncharacterized protein YozE (UPF0346 family)
MDGGEKSVIIYKLESPGLSGQKRKAFNMSKSFYHFLMKYRHPKPPDNISRFANDAYLDHSFPKNSFDYEEITSYLELNGQYLESMAIFDDAWDLYLLIEG